MSADPAREALASLAAPIAPGAAAAAAASRLETVAVFALVGLYLAALAFGPLPARLEARLGGRLGATKGRLLGAALIVAGALIVRLLVLFGLTKLDSAAPHGGALAAAVAGFGFDLVLFGLALFALRSVLAAAPRRGWIALSTLLAALAALVFLVPPLTLMPRLRGDVPAPAGAGRALLDLVRRDGVTARTLYVFKGANPVDVDVERVGPFAHLAVSRAALERPTPETFAALGHLLGHAVHHDLWGFVVLVSALGALLFAALSALPPRLQTRAAGGPRGAALLPLSAVILWGFAPVAVAAYNLFDQEINLRADAHALALTGAAGPLCRWLVRDSAPGDPDPPLLERVFFYTHPPLRPRLARVIAESENPRRFNGVFAQMP